jgi:hypothetical protein
MTNLSLDFHFLLAASQWGLTLAVRHNANRAKVKIVVSAAKKVESFAEAKEDTAGLPSPE